jgi:predicted nucleic acid-binding protein
LTPAFIIDCSITMSWCFVDESTPQSLRVQDRLEDEAALVPAHWSLEVTNVLATAEKRKRITTARSAEFLSLLETFDIEVDTEPTDRIFAQLLPLCRAHSLTSYDAAYLDLALRRRLPLATLDHQLRAAAKKLGVATLGK